MTAAGVTGMTRNQATESVAQLLRELGVAGIESLVVSSCPPTWVTAGGVLIKVGPESIRVASGLRCGLDATPALLECVAAANQALEIGQVWLADGSDDHHWSLVWQVKFPLEWATPIGLQRCLYTCATQRDRLLEPTQRNVSRLGGQDYRQTLTPYLPPGDLLLEQIG